MYRPSFTAILSGIFIAYVLHSMFTISKLFFPNTCEKDKLADPSCLRTSLKTGQESLRFLFLSTLSSKPKSEKDLTYFGYIDVIDLHQPSSSTLKVNIPKRTRTENATLFLAVFSLPLNKETSKMEPSSKWSQLMRHSQMTYSLTTLTQYQIPEAATFNLLGSSQEEKEPGPPKQGMDKPVVHIRSKIHLNIMTEQIDLPLTEVPPEIFPLVRAYQPDAKSKQEEYLPLLYINELAQRLRDLVIVNKTSESFDIEFSYSPIGFGKLRLFIQFSQSLASLQSLGFTPKDSDEVKGIFADTNLFLLLVTFGVSAIHLLFDFLAFKNDLAFWSKKRSMVGLSTRTIVWRAFSQSIIFLYLLDENTSLLVLIPSGIGALIEMWKVSKAFKVKVHFEGFRPKFSMESEMSSSEAETKRFDAVAMTYLSYILYPLCICGAIYSLIYTPHKSWYSWTIESLVNGVYAFGFLFMLPQLFVNYKLKSVAHLPWRAFMYKAFNTFIDDLFAFIITMPTAHRLACFRDDIVFLIYLYQRYLYPVDQSRVDMSGMIEETCDGENRDDNTSPSKEPERPQTRQRKHLKKE